VVTRKFIGTPIPPRHAPMCRFRSGTSAALPRQIPKKPPLATTSPIIPYTDLCIVDFPPRPYIYSSAEYSVPT
jgi:hypothetical protein